jgi:hypothetical protein
MLSIASPNTDRSLLTLAELRAAAGVSDGSKDATLIPMGNYISAAITSACKVTKAGAIPPTLRLETVTETFLFKSLQKCLVLARRPIVTITSLTQMSSVLSTNDYQADESSGIVYRKNGIGPYFEAVGPWGFWPGQFGWWATGSTVVEYSAGYATVPDDLKYAAIKFVKSEILTGSRDPLLKRLSVAGVSDREWWVSDKTSAGVVPLEVMDILISGGYVNMVVA